MRIVSPSLKLDVEDSIAGSEWISPGGELAGAASRTRTICPVRGRREGPTQGAPRQGRARSPLACPLQSMQLSRKKQILGNGGSGRGAPNENALEGSTDQVSGHTALPRTGG